ncbi:MAG: DUF2614 family zinc ribbon-containing protein [Tumebacillaceae bacterium]
MRLNRQRNLALGLIFGAFLIMYLGVFSHTILPIALLIGTIMILISVFIYLRVGAMSMRIPTVECPHCHKYTKVMGTEDGCMHCRKPIRLVLDDEDNLHAIDNTIQG